MGKLSSALLLCSRCMSSPTLDGRPLQPRLHACKVLGECLTEGAYPVAEDTAFPSDVPELRGGGAEGAGSERVPPRLGWRCLAKLRAGAWVRRQLRAPPGHYSPK